MVHKLSVVHGWVGCGGERVCVMVEGCVVVWWGEGCLAAEGGDDDE